MATIIKKKTFPNYRKYEMDLAGRPLTLEVGKLAELANAAVMVGYGDTRVLVCATASPRPVTRPHRMDTPTIPVQITAIAMQTSPFPAASALLYAPWQKIMSQPASSPHFRRQIP